MAIAVSRHLLCSNTTEEGDNYRCLICNKIIVEGNGNYHHLFHSNTFMKKAMAIVIVFFFLSNIERKRKRR
jgi:hypothetical protein